MTDEVERDLEDSFDRAFNAGLIANLSGFTPKQIKAYLQDPKGDSKTIQEYYGKPPLDPYAYREFALNIDSSYGAGSSQQPVLITSQEQFEQVYGNIDTDTELKRLTPEEMVERFGKSTVKHYYERVEPGRIIGSTIMTDDFREQPVDPIFAPFMNDVVKVSNVVGMNTHGLPTFQDWVVDLPFMQQAVIASGIRAMDGWEKLHQAKHLMRWFRRATMISSFEGVPLDTPYGTGGGSFTGSAPSDMSLTKIADLFLESRDGMSMHFYMHMMHAIQIAGYKHSNPGIRGYFYYLYKRMVNVMHCEPESQEAMDLRLCDNEQTWRDRMDENSVSCSD